MAQLKNIKENIDRRKEIVYLINFIISMMICMIFVGNKHFSTDDYSALFYAEEGVWDVVSSYRVPLAVVFAVLGWFHINCTESQIVLGILFLFVLSWCVTKVFFRLNAVINKNDNLVRAVLIDIAALLFFENAFLSEWLWFAGAYVQWAVALIGAVLAALYIGNENFNNIKWFVGSLWLLIAAGSYQIVIAQYVYLVMLLIFLNYGGKITVKSMLHICKAAGSAVIAILGNIMLTKLLVFLGIAIAYEGTRMSLSTSGIGACLKAIYKAQRIIWVEGLFVMPKSIMTTALAVLLVLFGICCVYKKVKILEMLYILVLLLSGQCVIYMSQILQGMVWTSIRVMLPIFGVYTIFICLICYYCETSLSSGRRILNFTMVFALVFCIINGWCVNKVAINVIKTNTLDKEYMLSISKKIHDYEMQNNVEITQVGFCPDAEITGKYYNHLGRYFGYSEVLEKASFRDWSRWTALHFYSGREFKYLEVPEHIRDSFLQVNWDQLDLEQQIIFDWVDIRNP